MSGQRATHCSASSVTTAGSLTSRMSMPSRVRPYSAARAASSSGLPNRMGSASPSSKANRAARRMFSSPDSGKTILWGETRALSFSVAMKSTVIADPSVQSGDRHCVVSIVGKRKQDLFDPTGIRHDRERAAKVDDGLPVITVDDLDVSPRPEGVRHDPEALEDRLFAREHFGVIAARVRPRFARPRLGFSEGPTHER